MRLLKIKKDDRPEVCTSPHPEEIYRPLFINEAQVQSVRSFDFAKEALAIRYSLCTVCSNAAEKIDIARNVGVLMNHSTRRDISTSAKCNKSRCVT